MKRTLFFILLTSTIGLYANPDKPDETAKITQNKKCLEPLANRWSEENNLPGNKCCDQWSSMQCLDLDTLKTRFFSPTGSPIHGGCKEDCIPKRCATFWCCPRLIAQACIIGCVKQIVKDNPLFIRNKCQERVNIYERSIEPKNSCSQKYCQNWDLCCNTISISTACCAPCGNAIESGCIMSLLWCGYTFDCCPNK